MAISLPSLPVDTLLIYRTASRYARVEPEVIRIFLPVRGNRLWVIGDRFSRQHTGKKRNFSPCLLSTIYCLLVYVFLSKYIFFPVADRGIPMTRSQSQRPIFRATAPMRYIILLSTLSKPAVLTAEPRAMPMSSKR